MREAYKSKSAQHWYRGQAYGRGGRQRSKVLKSVKGVASLFLLEAIAREDVARKHFASAEK
jgi:hypothetical protein